MIRTALNTVFCSGEGVVLGGARGNAILVGQGLVIWVLILEDTSVRVVTESFPVLEYIIPETRKNLHPARVVCPARWEASEYGEGSTRRRWRRWRRRSTTGNTSVVVHVQAERSTTKLRRVPRTDHVAVGCCRRGASATDGITAVLKTKEPIR
jgi:hypothetical protein